MAAIVMTLLSAAPASAEASVQIGASCNDAGNRRIRLTHDLKIEVQWFLDGRGYLEPSDSQQTIVASVPGDGKSHVIELLAMPSKELIEAFPVTFAACAGVTTTVSTTDAVNADLTIAYVAGIPAGDADGGLVVRSGPSTSNDALGVLPNDTKVEVLSWPGNGNWIEVVSPIQGWVGTKYLTTTAPSAATTTTVEATTSTTSSSDDATTTTAPATTAAGDDSGSGATIGPASDESDEEAGLWGSIPASNDDTPAELAASDGDDTSQNGDETDAELEASTEEASTDEASTDGSNGSATNVVTDGSTQEDGSDGAPDDGSSIGGIAFFAIGGLLLFGGIIAVMRRQHSKSVDEIGDAPTVAVTTVEEALPSGQELLAAASKPLPQRQRKA